jgi:hypothetical protein
MDENKKGYMQIKKWKFWGLIVLAWFLGAMFMSDGSSETTTEPKGNTESNSTEQNNTESNSTELQKTDSIAVMEETVATPISTTKKIGVSYDQMMSYLSNSFTMEESTPVDGEDRYMGTSSSGLAVLEIIGEKDNITQTSLMIGIPNDDSSLVVENSAIMVRFLKNAVPEWDGITDWFTASVGEFTDSSREETEKLYGNKVIRLTLIKQIGMMTATVEHNDNYKE